MSMCHGHAPPRGTKFRAPPGCTRAHAGTCGGAFWVLTAIHQRIGARSAQSNGRYAIRASPSARCFSKRPHRSRMTDRRIIGVKNFPSVLRCPLPPTFLTFKLGMRLPESGREHGRLHGIYASDLHSAHATRQSATAPIPRKALNGGLAGYLHEFSFRSCCRPPQRNYTFLQSPQNNAGVVGIATDHACVTHFEDFWGCGIWRLKRRDPSFVDNIVTGVPSHRFTALSDMDLGGHFFRHRGGAATERERCN